MQKADLGFKKMKRDLEDNENQVHQRLVSDYLDEEFEWEFRKLRIWSHLLKKSLMENFIFCAVIAQWQPKNLNHTLGKVLYQTNSKEFICDIRVICVICYIRPIQKSSSVTSELSMLFIICDIKT